MTTSEQRAHNAEKARKFRASEHGKEYNKSDKIKKYRRDWKREKRLNDPDWKRKEQRCTLKSSLKSYGLTWEDWERMLIVQSGRCALCGLPMNPNELEPCVDHCHKTGVVRGLLHNSCNAFIGLAEESLEKFNKAIDYLQSFSQPSSLL